MSAKVTFLDDNEDLRIMISRLLKAKLDVDCITVGSVDDLIEHCNEVLESDLAILDINLGSNGSGLDAYQWLSEHHFKGKSFFLTGYDETNPLVAKASSDGAEVYQKPMPTQRLLSLITNAIQSNSSKHNTGQSWRPQ